MIGFSSTNRWTVYTSQDPCPGARPGHSTILNVLPRNPIPKDKEGQGSGSSQHGKENTSIPGFISLQEHSSLGQRKFAEQTTRWSMKPGGVESRCCAEEEAPLKEEVQTRAALLDFTVLLTMRPSGRQDAPVHLL